MRLMDFDLPQEWFQDLGIFFRQEFDTKLNLVKELLKANMQGLKFPDIWYRETVKYLNVLSTITNVEREREIARVMGRISINEEAQRRFTKQ